MIKLVEESPKENKDWYDSDQTQANYVQPFPNQAFKLGAMLAFCPVVSALTSCTRFAAPQL